MKVSKKALLRFCDSTRYAAHGDGFERELGPLVTAAFPWSERMWQRFIVPQTQRMSGYPEGPTNSIATRPEVSPKLQYWAQVHYSIFMSLAYAQRHRLNPDPCALEDLYAHLGSACDLAEEFLELSYLILAEARCEKIETLQELSRAEFIKKAEEFYDESFLKWFESYKRRRQLPPLQVLGKSPLVREFLEGYLNRADLWSLWSSLATEVRQLRNVLIHKPQLGRIMTRDNVAWIPRPSVVSRYREWGEVFKAGADAGIFKRDFVPAPVQTCADLSRVSAALDQLWAPLADQLEDELFGTRDTLRKMYAIEL